jgi:CO/xanthine dehydrogenase Mo-binding subunit
MLGAISDQQRTELLKRLAETLSVHMTLYEQQWPPCVWCEGTSDEAASTAVQVRLDAICEEFGIPKDQVTTTLDPNRL